MTLGEFLEELGEGSCANLISVFDNGKVKDSKRKKVVRAVNAALDKLYKDFYLEEDSVYIALQDSQTRYEITKEHVMTEEECQAQGNYNKYLYVGDDFRDVMSIRRVSTDDGQTLPLNHIDNPLSIMTPRFDTIFVPLDLDCKALLVTYRCFPKHLENDGDEFTIPRTLYDCLDAYVTYLLHKQLNTKDSENVGQTYLQIYNDAIQAILTDGTIRDDYVDDCVKFTERGFR